MCVCVCGGGEHCNKHTTIIHFFLLSKFSSKKIITQNNFHTDQIEQKGDGVLC